MRAPIVWIVLIVCAIGIASFAQTVQHTNKTNGKKQTMSQDSNKSSFPVVKSDEEWKKELTPEQYLVLRKHGTEPAFTGKYWNNHEDGTYTCAACGQVLFKSSTKFDSGTGWPSFWAPVDKSKIIARDDDSYGMHRTEVLCSRCGGHLGHVFDDGPNPTGLRYCMNSVSLNFKKDAPAHTIHPTQNGKP